MSLLAVARPMGRSLTYLTRPFTVAEAFEAASADGTLTAVVKMPVGLVVGPEIGYDDFEARLVGYLADGLPAYMDRYALLGVAEGGEHVFVEVTQSLTAMLAVEGAGADFLYGIDADVVADMLGRPAA